MVAVVVCIGSSSVILLEERKLLLKLQSYLIILGPHFSFPTPPAPIDHLGLLVTFPAFVVVPHTNDNLGFFSALSQDNQRSEETWCLARYYLSGVLG
jgi:hypothetical protein